VSHSDEHLRDQEEAQRLGKANARIRELECDLEDKEAELQTYKEQRELDIEEIHRLESSNEEVIDWQGKAVEQIERTLAAWDCEIDANIITELEALREVMIQGRIQMGEL
jgi:molecular chaperone GrpE (heat shock protein)